MRAMLCGVPVIQVSAAHGAGFHVFDSAFRTTAEAFTCQLGPQPDMDLRNGEPEKNPSFTLAAGPLAEDASPAACQYEWSLHVRGGSNYDMYEFVSMLRQLVRCDQLNQSSRIDAYHNKAVSMIPAQPIHNLPPTAGSLEVVLVEARRLRPLGFETTMKYQESLLIHGSALGPLREETTKGLVGTKAVGDASSHTPGGHKLTTYCEFRLISVSENGQYETIPIKGEKIQTSHKIEDTDSPSWASLPGLQNSGGWVFRTGVIDSARTPELQLDFEVHWIPQVQGIPTGAPASIGAIQVPVFRDKYLSDPGLPFKDLWLPLAALQDGQPVLYPPLGEIHIMARWIPPNKIYLPPGQEQISMKSELEKVMAPKMEASRMKEPIYSLEAQYLNYNPNIVREGIPETPADHFRRNAQQLFSMLPYLDCVDRRQDKAWLSFTNSYGIEDAQTKQRKLVLNTLRDQWHMQEAAPLEKGQTQTKTPLGELEQLIRCGIPSGRRDQFWPDLLRADKAMESAERGPVEAYNKWLSMGEPQRSDAMLQLQEDAFHLAGLWESARPPNFKSQDALLKRMRHAQNVCTAIVAMPEAEIDYCESLLVLAFFLQLPQGVKVPKFELAYSDDWMVLLRDKLFQLGVSTEADRQELKVDDANGNSVNLFRGTTPSQDKFPITLSDDTPKSLGEHHAFWILLTLVSSPLNGAFREYFGKDQVWSHNAAMNDVNLLEGFLVGQEPVLFQYLSSIGFHLATVFYGAFMRLFATYMPTATVFRFWDILFAESTRPLTGSEKQGRAARDLLVTLAYAIVRSKKDSLLLCQSGAEAKDLILGVLGSLFDSSIVVDMVAASQYLLYGRKATIVTKARSLVEEHEEAFKYPHMTTVEQNELLKQMMHNREFRSRYSVQGVSGVTTTQLMEEIYPNLKQAFKEKMRNPPPAPAPVLDMEGKPIVPANVTGPPARSWGMFRPMPLAESLLLEGTLEKMKKHWNHSFNPAMPPLPYSIDATDQTVGAEPFLNQGDLAEILQYRAAPWSDLSSTIWKAFTNRRDRYSTSMPMYNPLAKVGLNIDNPMINDWLRKFQANPKVGEGADADERISVNEFLIGLIFCSKGTLGDKAGAAFALFAHSEALGDPGPFHMLTPSRLSKTLVEMSAQHTGSAVGKVAPPGEEDKKDAALRFLVKSTHAHKERHSEDVGEVFIPRVGLFVGATPEDAEVRGYNIWPTGNPQMATTPGTPSQNKKVQCIGELKVAICWTPAGPGAPEGQLCIRVKGITFYFPSASTNAKMNPWIEVTTISNGKASQVPRWDPRRLTGGDKHASIFKVGAFGGHIHFDQTMRTSGSEGYETFHHLLQHGEKSGWSSLAQEWQWNEIWGKQLSEEKFKFPAKGASELPKLDNAMSMMYARYITACILQRSMINVSNRQAMLIADDIFNRSGAVPGIIGAFIVRESDAGLFC
jgi:hypothetical protein